VATLLGWSIREDSDHVPDPSCGDGRCIAGHTNTVGIEQDSRRRAEAVADYLVKAGIDSGRLNAVGYGKARQIASNDTEEDRADNHCIEFQFK
jgi:OOP family OmpA-OmpF porin